MKTNFFIIIVFNTLSLFSILHSAQGGSVYEDIGNAHPFGHPTEKRHNILLHIKGDLRNKEKPEEGNENICFLIQSIEPIDKQIGDIKTIKTDHTTKKFIYDPQKKSLGIVGHKYNNSDQDCPMKMLTTDEISQIITPRVIVIAEKNEVSSTPVQMTKTLQSDATEYFYTTLQKKYPNQKIKILLKRFKADRSIATTNNPQLDNFPVFGHQMIAYLDLSNSSQPEQPSPNLTHNSRNPSPQNPSFFTFNKIVFISFVSLGAIFWYFTQKR